MITQNWQNRTLFHNDNLKVMRAMNSESVDLIATDPPFNKGRDFHATPDSLAEGAKFGDRWRWDEDVQGDWLDKLEDDFPKVMNIIEGTKNSYGDDMAAFMCFMGVRLLEMHRILKKTGTIYLHCDATASHYLKALMDSIFGKNQFLNELTWEYQGSWIQPETRYPRRNDTLLVYTKSENYTFNIFHDNSESAIMKTFNYEIWKKYFVYKDGKYRIYGSNIPNHNRFKPYLNRFKKKYGREPTDKDIVYELSGPRLGTVQYVKMPPANAKEMTGYPTQKPLELYKRIIQVSSDPNDIVFDPFCGCATTLVAAEMEKRQWVGIDIWKHAHKTVVGRLQDEGLIGSNINTQKNQGILALRGDISYEKDPPIRTDNGIEAVPIIKQPNKKFIPEPGLVEPKHVMKEKLVEQLGIQCQGCNRIFDLEEYLELDHIIPRSIGGFNHINNRTLLCSPCNRRKSELLTLKGLQNENKKRGVWKD